MRQHLILIFVCFFVFLNLFKSRNPVQAEDFEFAPDSTEIKFNEYRDRAELYLSRPIFRGTPMTGAMLANCAQQVWKEYGVLIPVELALAQAQMETKMGTGGRSGHHTNPYNLGEWADRTTLRFKTTEYGVMAYYDLLARRYLTGGKTVEDLYTKFIDKDGYLYAPIEYGPAIKKHVNQVKWWIDTNIQKERV